MKLYMAEFLSKIKLLPISRDLRKEQESECTTADMTELLGITRSVNFLGQGAFPQAAYVARFIQQKTGDLRVKHLTVENKLLSDI